MIEKKKGKVLLISHWQFKNKDKNSLSNIKAKIYQRGIKVNKQKSGAISQKISVEPSVANVNRKEKCRILKTLVEYINKILH